MSERASTKGLALPWAELEIYYGNGDLVTDQVAFECYDGGRIEVSDTKCAREIGALIVAAPDLLKAAKRALMTLKAQGESVRPGNVLGALTAAIAKAEGANPLSEGRERS